MLFIPSHQLFNSVLFGLREKEEITQENNVLMKDLKINKKEEDTARDKGEGSYRERERVCESDIER